MVMLPGLYISNHTSLLGRHYAPHFPVLVSHVVLLGIVQSALVVQLATQFGRGLPVVVSSGQHVTGSICGHFELALVMRLFRHDCRRK
jgi:hypothetical protein